MTTPKTAVVKVSAWFVAWRCGCAQTSTLLHDQTLPERCPGHNTERIHRPERLDVLAEHANTHLCGENPHETPCPEKGTAA